MLSEFGFRKDARLPKQIRNIIYQTGIYSNADGSAYIEQGGTKVSLLFIILKIYLRFFALSMDLERGGLNQEFKKSQQ